MAADEYVMNWSDNDLKPPFVLAVNTKDIETTALTLFGRGARRYGEGIQEDLIRLLENFCSPIPPDIKTVGQAWYDYNAKTVKYWDGFEWASGGSQVSATAPTDPTTGTMWTDPVAQELKVYIGDTWITLADLADLTDHIGNQSLHLTTAQNTLLDGLAASLTATELNRLDGVTSNVQTQLNDRYTKAASDAVLASYGIGTTDLTDYAGDTNLLYAGGFYLATGANRPTVGPAYFVTVITNGNNHSVQYATAQGTTDSYVRTSLSGAWSAWRRVAYSDSPALTGTPTAPTAALGTNTTQISTTAFVQNAITALIDSSPGALNTLNELAAALGDDPNFATTIATALGTKQPNLGFTPVQQGTGYNQLPDKVVKIGWTGTRLAATYDFVDLGNIVFDTQMSTALSLKANLAGATFTGAVTVPAGFTVTAQNATTEGGEIVLKKGPTSALGSDVSIDLNGTSLRIFENGGTGRGVVLDLAGATAGVGSSLATNNNTLTLTNKTINLTNNLLSGTLAQFNTACSDADFAPIASPSFSGAPTAPTATAGSNNLQIANTAFVQSAIQTSAGPSFQEIISNYGYMHSFETTAGDTGYPDYSPTVAYKYFDTDYKPQPNPLIGNGPYGWGAQGGGYVITIKNPFYTKVGLQFTLRYRINSVSDDNTYYRVLIDGVESGTPGFAVTIRGWYAGLSGEITATHTIPRWTPSVTLKIQGLVAWGGGYDVVEVYSAKILRSDYLIVP